VSGRVHVIALAARTPVGFSAEATAAAVRAGISRLALHPFMVDDTGEKLHAAFDPSLERPCFGCDRMIALASAALDELIAKLTKNVAWPSPIPVLLAAPEARPGFGDQDAQRLVTRLRASLPNAAAKLDVQLVGRGHAGGLHALQLAMQRMSPGNDLFVVGGVDSYLEADTIDWLASNRQLSSSEVRSGFVPGEGAGFIALGTEGALRQLRLTSLAVVRGAGTAKESKLIKTDAINLGEGLAAAIQSASHGLRLPDEAVDTVYCDINGERYRSEEWGFALLRGGQREVKSSGYVAPADCWGDVGAASGPLLCLLAVRSWARRYAAGPRALVCAGSESGLRGAVVLESP